MVNFKILKNLCINFVEKIDVPRTKVMENKIQVEIQGSEESGKEGRKKQHGGSVEDMLWVSEVAVDLQSRNSTGVS